jgi:hypothetical protein
VRSSPAVHADVSSILCKRPFFFLRRRHSGRWESGNPAFGFHFSTAHSFSSSLSVTARTTSFFLGAPRNAASRARARRGPLLADQKGLQSVRAVPGYARASSGTRSPSRIANRCKAAFQSCTGIVHFLAMCSSANSNFSAASGLGNDPRVLITLRSDMFSDSIALVV